jgi:hypothetical protein
MQVQQNKGKLQDARFIFRGSAKPVGDEKETRFRLVRKLNNASGMAEESFATNTAS